MPSQASVDGEVVVAFAGTAHPHIVPRASILLREPNVRIAGCYDPDPDLNARVAAHCGLTAFDTLDALLDVDGVNLVIVEGWDPDNPGYVRQAVRRGQAVLLEKPGAPNLTALEALLADIDAAPVPFQIGFMLSFSPAIAEASRILREGLLGHVTMARFSSPGPVGATIEPCLSVPDNLGGIFYGDASHVVDLVIDLFGPPETVDAKLLRLPVGPDVVAFDQIADTITQKTLTMPFGGGAHEDGGAAILEYPDKLVLLDMTAWGARPWVESWSIEISGTEGTLWIGLQPPWYKLFLRQPMGGLEAGWHEWRGEGVSGYSNSLVPDVNYRRELAHILDRVRRWDTDNAAARRRALSVVKVLDGVYRADRDGRRATV